MKNNISWTIISFALLASFAMIFIYIIQSDNADTYNIGAVLPLTGDVAVYGNNTKNGIDLAIEEVNNNGGVNGKKLKIIYEDSEAIPRVGVSAINKLISSDNIQIVIDNSVSSVTLAMEPVATENQVVILSTGATSPKLSGISNYFFRIWNSDDLEGKVAANFVSDSLIVDKIDIVYVNNDYGIGLANVFEDQIELSGGGLNNKIAFEQNSSNLRPQIAKAIDSELIYLVGYTNDNARVLNLLREFGYDGIVLGTVTMEDQKLLEIAGEAANNVFYPFPKEPDPENQVVSNFKAVYNQKYNEKPGITADVGYDSVYLIAEAIKKSGNFKGPELMVALRNAESYYGASGLIEFDEEGNVNKPMVMKKIINGEFKTLDH